MGDALGVLLSKVLYVTIVVGAVLVTMRFLAAGAWVAAAALLLALGVYAYLLYAEPTFLE